MLFRSIWIVPVLFTVLVQSSPLNMDFRIVQAGEWKVFGDVGEGNFSVMPVFVDARDEKVLNFEPKDPFEKLSTSIPSSTAEPPKSHLELLYVMLAITVVYCVVCFLCNRYAKPRDKTPFELYQMKMKRKDRAAAGIGGGGGGSNPQGKSTSRKGPSTSSDGSSDQSTTARTTKGDDKSGSKKTSKTGASDTVSIQTLYRSEPDPKSSKKKPSQTSE